ncbi:MAG TPA: DinB family protein, partial [Gemmatimonadaceae bacterium]
SIVESRITGLLHKRIEEARAAGLGTETETSSILDQPGLEQVANRARPLVAPEPVRPTSTLDAVAAWKALDAARERLRTVLLSADGLAVGQISHPHTFFGPLTVYQWFAFVAGHEARHTAQIREIMRSLSA